MMNTNTFAYRAIEISDIPDILHIQAENYPISMQEDEGIVRSRILAAPDTSLLVLDHHGVCGYLFAYPSLLGRVAALNRPFVIARKADTLYLHDLAISRRVTGAGLGKSLVSVATELGKMKGFTYSSLMSVQDSLGFWKKLGYQVRPSIDHASTAALHSYPDNAVYMVKPLVV
ncbi:GNAT family N-acetyltransferase [Noviherbaspirillum saxi]|uniref:GNAT family N-acetyltransferase n=1 Tax=Noviherbaspirillum saxi TaxID=2320863 RepID=A0A3A3FFV4_9BURK|nr:GNAT family N-acetyltransferase [Noviherbaspirillum saxi]RJF91947.1 GNAT family N-acetyltransferase [Noviherbaspirillum saxi]